MIFYSFILSDYLGNFHHPLESVNKVIKTQLNMKLEMNTSHDFCLLVCQEDQFEHGRLFMCMDPSSSRHFQGFALFLCRSLDMESMFLLQHCSTPGAPIAL